MHISIKDHDVTGTVVKGFYFFQWIVLENNSGYVDVKLEGRNVKYGNIIEK